MSDKGIGSRILGIFVETPDKPDSPEALEPEQSGRSPADLVAELAQASAAAPGGPGPGPGAPARQAAALESAIAAAPTDFDTIFKDSGMDADELDRVRKAEELLKSLPEATPIEVKRQIVEASLKAFGFDTARILAAAQTQQKALDAYVRVNESATAKSTELAQQEIASLNEKIASLRTDIEKRTATLKGVAGAASARKLQLQKVLDFFGTVPKV
jgi:hypothetical protein